MRPVLLLLCLAASVCSFKILIYSPRFGASHVSFLGRVADILVEEGMDVTVLLPKMNSWLHSNGTKLAKTITIETDPRVVEMLSDEKPIASLWNSQSADFLVVNAMLDVVKISHGYQCETNLQQTDILESLKNEKFDLGISEVFDMCGLALFEEIGLEKHVIMQTALMPETVAEVFGVPNLPAIVPGYFSDVSMNMNYMERAVNFVKSRFGAYRGTLVLDSIEEIYEKTTGKRVDLWRKMTEASFVFTNADPLVDFPRPTSERIVNIGSISVPKPKPLDAYWEEVVNKRKTTVLMSFGSVAQSFTMPDEMKRAVLETFKRFPEVTFIWKYERDEDRVAEGVANVITNKWVPQNDLLNHPNLKLFITHAGMNSILEAAQMGAPLLTVPLFGDQMRNAKCVNRFGVSRVLNKADLLNPKVFEAEIREILENDSYRNNASRLSKMMTKRPRNQRDQLVQHIRFAAEFGSLPEYRIPQVSFVQYYMLDIIIPLLLVSFIILISVALLTVRLFKRVFCQKPEKAKMF